MSDVQQKQKLRIPYGESNFAGVRDDNGLYIDKTKYLTILEQQPKFQFFIRPRRFGKSLFLSMMYNYYDINKQKEFDKLFNGLYIGANPTVKRNSYMVLNLSFAGILTSEGKERLLSSFVHVVALAVRTLGKKYKKILEFTDAELENIINEKNADKIIHTLVDKVAVSNHKIMVLIDEYDNFANDIIARNNEKLYYELVTGEGYVRAFYKALKEGTQTAIDRIFITGVSPIMLDDLTSGFNISHNLTLNQDLNAMLGFTEEEVRQVLEHKLLLTEKWQSSEAIEEILSDMRHYYNGYLFNKNATEKVYNSDMVLYFWEALQRTGNYPENVLDENVKTDYSKLEKLARHFKERSTSDEAEQLILKLGNEGIETVIVDRFSLETMYDDEDNYFSFMFYLGMLTIKEPRGKRLVLNIPNLVVKKIYWEYYGKKIRLQAEIRKQILYKPFDQLYVGDLDGFRGILEPILENLSNRDLMKFDEKYIKLILISMSELASIYIADSEYEVSSGYIDILFKSHPSYKDLAKYDYLIELKYLKESERGNLNSVRQEAIAQLNKYYESYLQKERKIFTACQDEEGQKRIAAINQEKISRLKKVLIIVIGKKEVLAEEVI